MILDLCGGTGAWSRPYAEAGYEVTLVTLPEYDVRTYQPPQAHGILAAPPCTEFAVSGARWWAGKSPELLREALGVVWHCFRIIEQAQPVWWALENPVGRLTKHIGPWQYMFQPYEYGDPWLKRTCVWGDHMQPEKQLIPKPEGKAAEWVHRCPPSTERVMLRSVTPPGFARAFFEANP